MSDEPDNLMLRLLRVIRDTPQDQSVRLREIRRQMHDWQETTATTLGFAGHANVRSDSLRKQIDELTARLDRLERQH